MVVMLPASASLVDAGIHRGLFGDLVSTRTLEALTDTPNLTLR